MSLLDHGPETITIYTAQWGQDADGNVRWLPSAVPVTVSAWVQPVSSTEQVLNGQLVVTVYRVIARSAPLGVWSQVTWNGRDFDVIGETQTRRYSVPTAHVSALIRARGTHDVERLQEHQPHGGQAG